MASFPSNVLEAAAVESLLRMNAEQLNRDECDGASDVLFGIYSAGINVKESNKIANRSGMDFYRPKGNLSIPLSTPDDADYLSPLQCYIRKHCVEYFEATDADNSNSSSKHKQQRGRRTPIVIGRVGIRCVFCKDCPFSQRASQSTAFPSNLEKIYSSVVMWQCRHAPQCHKIPTSVKKQLGKLKRGYGGGLGSNGAGRNSIWAESAASYGLVDTSEGIKFLPSSIKSDDEGELAQINEKAVATINDDSLVVPKPIRPWVVTPDGFIAASDEVSDYEQLIQSSELVSINDCAPPYLAIVLAQYKRCHLTASDKVGWYKSRDLGSVGLCCKWCEGEGSMGRYFPKDVKSLSHTKQIQTIVKHICSCPKCPTYISNSITALSDSNASGHCVVPSNGNVSRFEFIKKLWKRLHVPEMPSDGEVKSFRPIQESETMDPVVEYESLEARPLVDNNGCRVSVSVEGIYYDAAHVMPGQKKRKM